MAGQEPDGGPGHAAHAGGGAAGGPAAPGVGGHEHRFSLIGCGRLGTALAAALAAGGWQPIACCDRRPPGAVVLHCAGALDESVLAPIRVRGPAVGSCHPIRAFGRTPPAAGALTGTVFGVSGDRPAREAAAAVAQACKGAVLDLTGADRSAYHAACVMAAGGLAGLLLAAADVFGRAVGLEPEAGLALLTPLAASALEGLAAAGPAGAAGPVMRGDTATVAAHLAVLAGPAAEIYRRRGARLLESARSALDPAAAAALEEILTR